MLNQSNKFREFLGGNGNFLPLIDALDGCHNESVNMKVLQLFVNLLTGDSSYINLKHTLQEKFLLMDSSSLAYIYVVLNLLHIRPPALSPMSRAC